MVEGVVIVVNGFGGSVLGYFECVFIVVEIIGNV